MLKRFYVDNFRCLVNFEFRPDQVNLILGKNGSGKSTFLDAILVVVRLIGGASPQTVLSLDSLPWWDNRRVQTFELELDDPLGDHTFGYRLVVQHSDRGPSVIVEERLRLGGQTLLQSVGGQLSLPGTAAPIPFDGKQSILALGLGRDTAVNRFVTEAQRLYVFKLNPWAFEAQAREEERMLWTNGANLVGFLRSWLQSAPEAFVLWKRRVLDAMKHLEDIQLRELVAGSRILVGMRHVEGREILLSLANFSEGERALLALHAIAGLANSGRFIALDEPDNFLAPSEIQPVLRLFTVAPITEPPPQLFVVTHHPESIDYLAPYSTWVFERQADGLSRLRKMEFDREKGERPSESMLAEFSA